MAKSYSVSKEMGYSSSLRGVVNNYISINYPEFPFELDIYEGEDIVFKPGHFIPHIASGVSACAEDECGESSNHWVEKINKKEVKLQNDMEEFFNKWCNDNDAKIDFVNSDNVTMNTYIIIDENTYERKIEYDTKRC